MYHNTERHRAIVFIIGIMACLVFDGCQEKPSEPSRELTKATVATVPAIVEAPILRRTIAETVRKALED